MKLARIMLFRRLIEHRHKEILLINTVHDSIMVDCVHSQVNFVCDTINAVFADLPKAMKQAWKIDCNVPLGGEIEVGPNWLDMIPWEREQYAA